MGVVYRGYQPSLGRVVAIKMLLPEHARSREFQRRFRNEADAVAALAHPSIVRIHDIVEAEGTTFIVMEFVAGPSVDRVLSAVGSLAPARAASIACQTANALSAAHAAGIVHRDVKPPNLMLDAAGTVKVMDFGIAKMSGSALRTQAGIRLGTPYYMSPEQAQGKPFDARSDIYSLSVVLFELLAGRPPFHGDDPFAVALKHVTDPAPDLASVRPGLPEPLPSAVRRGLAKAPSERFQSAAELAALLAPLAEQGERRFARYEARAGEARCPSCAAPCTPGFASCPQCGAATTSPCAACAQPFGASRHLCPFCWSKRGEARPSHPPPLPPPLPPPSAEVEREPAARRFGRLLAGLAERLPSRAAFFSRSCACGGPIRRGFLRCPLCGREVSA